MRDKGIVAQVQGAGMKRDEIIWVYMPRFVFEQGISLLVHCETKRIVI